MSKSFLEAFPDIIPNDIFQASIVDEHGNEQPITEQMILKACEALENQSFTSSHAQLNENLNTKD